MCESEKSNVTSCRNCGDELPESAAYCPKCGAPVQIAAQARLAFWSERFLAWLIDVALLGMVMAILGFLMPLGWSSLAIVPRALFWVPFVDFGFSNVVYLLYWMFMEGVYGRSLGKMVMRLKVTRLDGEPVNMMQAALESVGKAFLLPLDLILGWILHPRKRQRIFNYLSGTIVLRT